MTDSPDKPADQLKKVRRRTGEGEGLTDADEEKAPVVADVGIESSVPTPTPLRTADKTAKKVAGPSAQDVSGKTGQAARMRFRRDRRPRR
jgi:hypothetical protein